MYTSTTHAPGTCVEGLYVSYFTVAKEPVCTLQQHTLQVHVTRGLYVSYFTVAKEPGCTLQQHTLQVHVLRGYMSLISLLLRSQCVHFNNTHSRYMC